MSITVPYNTKTRPWGGYTHPSLPIATWYAEGNVTGDSSGGHRAVQLNFSPGTAGQASPALYYSLEQISLADTLNADRDVLFQLINGDEAMTTGSQWWQQGVSGTAIGPAALNFAARSPALWLGNIKLPGGGAHGMLFVMANSNTHVLTVVAQGYVWGARSISWPGGPQRPPNGLFQSAS